MESDKTGYLSLSSVDSDNNLLSGVTFGIYSDEDCTEVVGDFVIIENEPITIELLVGTYYVKVVEVPKDYKLNETVYTVEIVEDEISELVVSIELGTGYLSLSATDSNGAVVSGVVLGVYLDENCTELVVDPVTITNDAVVVELEVGTYYVKEIEVPEKYVLSNSVYSVDVVNCGTTELIVEVELIIFTISAGSYEGDDAEATATLLSEPSLPMVLEKGDSITLSLGMISNYEVIIPQPEPDTYTLILFDNGKGHIILEGLTSLRYEFEPGEMEAMTHTISDIQEDHVLSFAYFLDPIDESILGDK